MLLGPRKACPIRTVAVIGAGHAGRRFAMGCITAGFHVTLEDVMPAHLRHAKTELSDLHITAAPELLSVAATVEDAVQSADIVVDFVPDELESKLEILSLIDRMAPPRTITCTPTQGISITDLASCTYRPERCFALRGLLTRTTRLLYPATADPLVLDQAATFFRAICSAVTTEPDPDLPMLMKNIVYTR